MVKALTVRGLQPREHIFDGVVRRWDDRESEEGEAEVVEGRVVVFQHFPRLMWVIRVPRIRLCSQI